MTTITIFMTEGEKNFTDDKDRLFDFRVVEGHCEVTESVRRIPGRDSGFRTPRVIHVYPPGTWIEVEVDYGS